MEGGVTLRAIATEAGVFGVFLVGLLISRALRRRWHPAEVAVMYLAGLLFELLTAHFWTYHHIFLVLPTRVDLDISIIFPLGWAGFVMAVTAVTEEGWRRWRMRRIWARAAWMALVSLTVGDAFETFFYRIGMIEYVRSEETRVAFILGQLPGLPPSMILSNYAIVLPCFVLFFRWLERGLGGRTPRPKR